jgi:hypothetical protein
MTTRRYGTDLTDEESALLEPFLPKPKRTGRPMANLREVLDAIFYLLPSGCHSAEGCRFVECILTAVQTLRLQGRPVLRYLHEDLVAHRHGLPTPSLLPTA